ncbi:hypothetical protein HO133_009337 [Letharia lupina]|uniref:Clavaminate synthase-like protein n=1 Tax=Letharia lupina TaxID=560253 RepID=A0A8H6CNS0_9LECA|nr:uncharacterized protein HO133_009337 [Letharia lupina]KAF6226471.1 hypothetical protein HO133_009337 [Letharia lupina]
MYEPRNTVIVSLEDLKHSSVPFQILEEAFGPSSLGILIVKDLPQRFSRLRHKVLSYASYLANLPTGELDALSRPSAKYLSGWSHGKEALKSGSYDTLKGSYYVNCAFFQGEGVTVPSSVDFPEFTAPNVWPAETSLPGFQVAFEELCTLIIDTAVLVARTCDQYAVAHIEDYEPGYLEQVVKSSMITKARLLHYFPPAASSQSLQATNISPCPPASTARDHDSWCATHIDHGCLTGLTSAIYVDEAAHPPQISMSDRTKPSSTVPALPFLPSAPDPDAGLYIHARDSTVTKVSIPPDCLAFQTGEALQIITGGKFRAVPHFVRAGGAVKDGTRVARNTLAVFTQPGLDEVVDRAKGTTFGEFSREVTRRFG